MRSISIYALSSGFEKGLFFLLIPIVSTFGSNEQIGELTLIITTLKLVNPILSLNAPASIIRYGTSSLKIRNQLFATHILILGLFTIGFSPFYYFNTPLPKWLLYGLILGVCDASYSILLSIYRAQDKEKKYLLITILKFTAFLLPLIIRYFTQMTFEQLLNMLLTFNILLSTFLNVITYIRISLKEKNSRLFLSFTQLLPYIYFSMSFYVHSLSQWLINSSDRYIIPFLIGKAALGHYSIAYSYSMILLILNSAIGLYIPTQYMKNINSWLSLTKRQATMMKMIKMGILINIIPPLFFLFNNYIYSFFPAVTQETALLSIFISSSFIFLISYHFFVNFLFFYKKGLALTKVTITCGVINILFNVFFLESFGIWVAAISTWGSYLIYYLLVRKTAMKANSNIKSDSSDIYKPILSSVFSFIVSACLFLIGSYLGE